MENKMWKRINKITKIILILLLIPYVYFLIKGIVYNLNGWYLAIPGPGLFKWYEIFLFEAIAYAIYSGIILIADIVVLIISSKKIKKQN